MPSKQFHLHAVNLYCFSPLLDHLIQSCCPEDVQEALRPFDDVIPTTAKLALGLDLADQITLRRARLSPSRSGLMLRQRGGHGHGGGFLPDAAFRGCQGRGKGSTDFYETLRKDHKLRVLSGGLFKKIEK
jgi:hypothetical protein